MNNLLETKLQKAILVIAGLVVVIRLGAIEYRDSIEAILITIVIAILAFVLLILTRNYKPDINALANYYLESLKKYATFSGRAGRKEFWYFTFINFLILVIVAIINPLMFWFYYFSTVVPHTAVGVRRLHDINKSGWWLFMALIPIVGSIMLVINLAKGGQSEDNQYGRQTLNVQ